MRVFLFGAPAVSSSLLNALIILVEALAVLGFYASPFIIQRFSLKPFPLPPERARRSNILYTLSYILIVAVMACVFKLGLIVFVGVFIWFPVNGNILAFSDEPENGVRPVFPVPLISKYSEIVIYLIVGVLTTIVSWGMFYLLGLFLDSQNSLLLALNNTISWIVAVGAAYPMNRCWVFKSKNPEILKELTGFTVSRISTWLIELVLMWLLVNILRVNQFISKYLICSVLIIILNYIFSKLLVFRKKA